MKQNVSFQEWGGNIQPDQIQNGRISAIIDTNILLSNRGS